MSELLGIGGPFTREQSSSYNTHDFETLSNQPTPAPYDYIDNESFFTRSRTRHLDEFDSDLQGLGSVFSDDLDSPQPELTPSLRPSETDSQSTEQDPDLTTRTHVLHEIYVGEEPRSCDVIFVHGLNGNAFSTWQSGDVLWPRDLLPRDIPNARIYSFGYEVPIWSLSKPTPADTIAENLLAEVAKIRSDDTHFDRPLIWIAHSLGGLIVKGVGTYYP
ncbi:uncharacterized protein BDZ99DRAFT_206273 [Mytilinidion resinicola]|uniref:DUF676 domain-containing protein n=1 Tax=Mytilinidion resinicola TaxID=574789 RepID=A0A6A6Y2T4_9PEZI|nr:uncharacterized protein BDZ99DRAFT_206273 [Mytilinidion resinicola]KAF2802525.1 hypothetical protein BDZ99DRAFT_206273 [Mytilinidion resinicola]